MEQKYKYISDYDRPKDILDYDQIYNEIQKALENNLENVKFKECFLDIASTEMICWNAHECSHANQMQQGLDNGAQCTKSLHKKDDIDKIHEFYYGIDENGKTHKKLEEDSEYKRWMLDLDKQNKLNLGYGVDSINEAAVMAMAYVAFLEMGPSPETISNVNSDYNLR